ncbi:GNAT family N-acetyltransferase [Crocosphaera chwakensis]|uniref:GCN5-related N-acetyltransferase n=1 Tax=Crocosphaera chwakensis CCY0110 TaxID=391612 RepID=A3IK63_9CHRO|nr:GNAT family N-acetyltransferase [Crocosphaera chwakensis]EAZ93052.1 GCN5-related N-acetyltransferase [Crocosphaera chwakensis CCY0110]
MDKIRLAELEDLEDIVEIYNSSIPSRIATGDLQKITVESRLKWFQERDSKHYPIWVIENDNKVIGWISLQHFYGRPAYKSTAEISLYIAQSHRSKGIGKKLLEYVIQESPKLELTTLLGFIFAHNQPSLNLFKKYNFQQWGYLPKVAQLDNIERDLIIMGLRLDYSKI